MTARPTPRVLPVDAVLLAALEQEEQAQARLLAIPEAAAAFGVKVRGMLDIPARQGAALAAIGDHPEAAEIRRLVVAAAHGRWRAAHQYRDLARAASVRWCKGRPDLDHNEVTASATEGLYQAAVRWRPGSGATFATYGRWWLRARLYREFPEIQGMHIPGHLAERLRYARRLADQGLSDAEICERLDLSPELLTAGRVAQQPSLSLDHLPTDDGDEGHLHAVVASTGPTPEELAEEAQRFDQLRAALAQLPDREREIIEARFGLCGEQLTLTEVGKRLGRSRERMRQIERHALTTLRDLLTTTPVPPSPLEALVAPIDRLVQIVTDNPGITQREAAMAMGVGDGSVFALVQGYPDRVVKRTEGKRARLYLPTPSSASPGVVVPTSGVGLPVSGAEDRAQVAALGAVPPGLVPSGPYVDRVRELAAARREIERLEREAKDNDRTIASGATAFAALHRLCDEAGVPNHNGEIVARVRELARCVGPCQYDEVMRIEESLIRLLVRACPGVAWAGREAAEAAITQALDLQGVASADLAEALADLKAADAQVVAAHRACDEAGVRDGDLDWRVQALADQARHAGRPIRPGYVLIEREPASTSETGVVYDVWGPALGVHLEPYPGRALAIAAQALAPADTESRESREDWAVAALGDALRHLGHNVLPADKGPGPGCGDAMRGFEAACLRLSNAVSGAEDRAQVAALGAAKSMQCVNCRGTGTIEGIDRFGEPDGARVACERCGGGDQPAPSGGVGDVWAEIIALLPEGSRARALAVERRQVGIDRYGVPLGRGDGRDEVRDEREELMDAAGYRQRRIGRPGALAQGVDDLMGMAVDPDAWWEAWQESADRDLDQAHEVSRILADADVGPGTYVERIRELAARGSWTDREANAWRAVMQSAPPTVRAVIAALSGVTP